MLRSVIHSFSDISVEMERLFNSTKCQPDVVMYDHHSKKDIRQLFTALGCFIIVWDEVFFEIIRCFSSQATRTCVVSNNSYAHP